ncbi:MAG: hypothetical protein M0C28_14215 [Candidatus Moduliflexus flocculans]|nr:hypothetical protein [Candidatus Moduliflexus flocculans]
MLARLFYPVASPHIDYAFCKGYYARVTDRMHGRVTRLFVTPLRPEPHQALRLPAISRLPR